MKKAVLIDGNNILFRSYFATAYHGSILRNSKGFPTNALYGFINMLNKIIKEEDPSYMMIAFDKGKTFRHDKYKDYKGGRNATPEELKEQFPVAKKIAKAMGIKCFEIDNYEADDIIGTFAKEVDINDSYIATIISSDKDLLQLISNDCTVKLLKTNDFIMMNKKTFIDNYGITPDHMIDLKALMGDSSDNIPGVKGIGEKTALSLLQKYNSLDGVYENINGITGKTKEKLEADKDNAYFSKELVTICKDVPIDKNLDNIKYTGITDEYKDILREYEFFSILKKLDFPVMKSTVKKESNIDFKIVSSLKNNLIDDDFAFYLETNGSYNDKNVVGLAIYNSKASFFISGKDLKNVEVFKNNYNKYTYDLKKALVSFEYINIPYSKNFNDLMLEAYILNYDINTDVACLMEDEAKYIEKLLKEKDITIEEIAKNTVLKAKYIYDNKLRFLNELSDKELDLYQKIELPLTYVLADMEKTGVLVDKAVLENMKKEVGEKLKETEYIINDLAGVSFNIMSPKQLGTVLFEKLLIPYPKKVKDNSYSTSVDILNKIKNFPVVSYVLEYRALSKLYSNYIVGLLDVIKEDGRIHTTFNQTLTRTGRLSSENPNLQNIPAREEYGRLVRKAFIPSFDGYMISSDYSQIELRVFAHMSKADNLISAFKSGLDIHTKTAMDIYHLPEINITKNMRRNAKAVNFGILYGISSFGLSEDLGIDVKEAKKFIDDYLDAYPGIRDYKSKLIDDAKKNGFVETLFGRRRVIKELNSSNYMVRSSGERMALNTPIQGTAADILKKAMIEIYNKFSELNLKSKMIIQVHDELVFDCPIEEKSIVIQIVKDIMENTYKISVPLTVEISDGKNWYEAK